MMDRKGGRGSPTPTSGPPGDLARDARLKLVKGETPGELQKESRRWDAGLAQRAVLVTAAWSAAGAIFGAVVGVAGAVLWAQLTAADTTLARLVVGAFLGGGGGSLLAFMIGGPLAVKRIRKEHRPPGDREQSTEQSKEGW